MKYILFYMSVHSWLELTGSASEKLLGFSWNMGMLVAVNNVTVTIANDRWEEEVAVETDEEIPVLLCFFKRKTS